MAESVMTYMISQRGLGNKILVDSAAAHTDEIGNPPYPGTCKKLASEGIPLVPHRARLMTREDGDRFDLLVGMDWHNVSDMRRIVGYQNASKVCMLLDCTEHPRAVVDPWYTGDFDATYRDITEGCAALLDRIVALTE